MAHSDGDDLGLQNPPPTGTSEGFDRLVPSYPPTSFDIIDPLDPDSCTICLANLPPSEAATVLPCHHAAWHFSCVATWLEVNQVCPLCKSSVSSITYIEAGATTIHQLLPRPKPLSRQEDSRGEASQPHQARLGRRTGAASSYHPRQREDALKREGIALAFRRSVYRNNVYALHIGANAKNRYRNFSPRDFQGNDTESENMRRRARAWIRRELRVFGFLGPELDSSPAGLAPQSESSASASRPTVSSPSSGQGSTSSASQRTRLSTREYLLEYIVQILQTIDIRASTGQAEALLAEHLGRPYARLFLHELYAFLRSPCQMPSEWDRVVQYPNMPTCDQQLGQGGIDQVANSSGSHSLFPRKERDIRQWFGDNFVMDEGASDMKPP